MGSTRSFREAVSSAKYYHGVFDWTFGIPRSFGSVSGAISLLIAACWGVGQFFEQRKEPIPNFF